MSNFSDRGVLMERKDCMGCGYMEVLKGVGEFIWRFYCSRLERGEFVGCQCKEPPANAFPTTFARCIVALHITTPTVFWCVAFSVPQ